MNFQATTQLKNSDKCEHVYHVYSKEAGPNYEFLLAFLSYLIKQKTYVVKLCGNPSLHFGTKIEASR